MSSAPTSSKTPSRYTQNGGRVTVRVSVGADRGRLFEVEDDGPGIPEEERTRVFERFYRVPEEVVGTKSSGSGLGLAIVREIANAHGAEVKIMSARAASGAIVQVCFNHQTGEANSPPADRDFAEKRAPVSANLK